MARAINKACRKPACGNTTTDRSGYCDKHKEESGWVKWHGGKTRTERGYGYAWDKLRLRILKRDKYICQCSECKKHGMIREAHEVDHIIAKANGGLDNESNLQAINRECHKRKTVLDRMGRGMLNL